MKSSDTAAILSSMIDNEVVKFEDETGIVITTITKSVGMFRLATLNNRGLYMSCMYFDRYEEDGENCLRLFWGKHITGMLFTVNMEKE